MTSRRRTEEHHRADNAAQMPDAIRHAQARQSRRPLPLNPETSTSKTATRSATTYLLEQRADDFSDFDRETRGNGAGGFVQRRVAALPGGRDHGGMLAEAAR